MKIVWNRREIIKSAKVFNVLICIILLNFLAGCAIQNNHSKDNQKEQTDDSKDNQREQTDDSKDNQKEQTELEIFDSTEEKGGAEKKAGVRNNVIVDVSSRKIVLSDQYITSMYKNLYADKEEIGDIESINQITNEINNSEIAELSIDHQKVFESESSKDLFQYPIVLNTADDSYFLSIDFLAQDENEYFVQLRFSTETKNIINAGDSIIPTAGDGKIYVISLVKSKELYDTIKKLWGNRVSFSDLKNPKSIQIFYNSSSYFYSEENTGDKIKFTSEDAGQFIQALSNEAFPVYDDHSFGITFLIKKSDGEKVKLYFSEDGCSMFQLDGVVYLLKGESISAKLAAEYIKRLETKANEKEN